MTFRQKNTKLILKLISTTGIYFHLTLSWKAIHAAKKENQNNLDMYFVKFTAKADPKEQTMALKTEEIFD